MGLCIMVQLNIVMTLVLNQVNTYDINRPRYYVVGKTAITFKGAQYTEGYLVPMTATEAGSFANLYGPVSGLLVPAIGGLPVLPPGTTLQQFQMPFTYLNLSVGGILIVDHDLGAIPKGILVYDNANEQVLPDKVTFIGATMLTVDLSSWNPISGAWLLTIIA